MSPAAGRSRRRGTLVSRLLVLAALGVAVPAVAVAAGGEREQAVTVRTPDGEVLAQLPLGERGRFAVSYRNSVYRSLAEERYRVLPDGRFVLVQIAADEVAVLEEYYAVPSAPRPAPAGDRRVFVVAPDPDRPADFEALNIAATDLGERTLWVPGHQPVPLWRRVVGDDPTVLLKIEETR